MRACVFDAYGTLFDFASAASAPVPTCWATRPRRHRALARQAAAIHLAARAAGPPRRLLAGHRRRPRLLAGDAGDRRAGPARSPDEPLSDARLLSRGAGGPAAAEGAGLRTAILSNGSPSMLADAVAAAQASAICSTLSSRSRRSASTSRTRASISWPSTGSAFPRAPSRSSPRTPGMPTRPRPSACASCGAIATASAASGCRAPPTARSRRSPSCRRYSRVVNRRIGLLGSDA